MDDLLADMLLSMLDEFKKPKTTFRVVEAEPEEILSSSVEKSSPASSEKIEEPAVVVVECFETSTSEEAVEKDGSRDASVESVVEHLFNALVDDVASDVLAIQDARADKDIVRPPLPKSPTGDFLNAASVVVERAASPIGFQGENSFKKLIIVG